ncbi:uncharacterized protein LOC124349717 isoform X2 [Daphnia pulicaria]|jgi:hypothetical protein|nr:uncharacterized protein LOC124349717 isoform X2 [Daphnia pulicaria]
MPTVLIWLPEGANIYGHAALQTDKYHISFWPFKGKRFRFSESSITGRLHFHEQLDCISEGSPEKPRGPTSRHEIVNVTNEVINREYEKFLRYNEINPEEVTLEAASRKYFQLCHRQLPLTRYSLIGDVIDDKRIKKVYSDLFFFIKRCLTPGWGNIDFCRECINKVTTNQLTRVTCPFYHKAQSCVSMCFNLIEMADRRRLVCLVEARNNTRQTLWSRFWQIVSLGGGGICLEITVPNFEKHVVKKYWIEGSGKRVHYDSNDFQKRSRFLMMSENFFKKVLMVGPTIFFLAWLHNCFNYSFLYLFGLTWIIHLIYFVLLYRGMKMFPSLRLPKVVAFIGGPLIFLFLLLNNFLIHTTALNLGKNGLIFFFFVKFYEIIFCFLVD